MGLNNCEYLTRRASIQTILAIILSSGSAGCLLDQSGVSRGITDIEIYNKTREMAHVNIQVTSLNDGDTRFEQDTQLPPETGICFNNKVLYRTNNQVDVQIEDGPNKSWKWTDVSSSLYVLITQNGLNHQVGERPSGVRMEGMCTGQINTLTQVEKRN